MPFASTDVPFTAVAGLFYCTVWGARLSIILTVLRIAPWAFQKRLLVLVAVVIFLEWVLLMVQLFWICEKGDTSWKDASFALCRLGLRVAITRVVSKHCTSRCFEGYYLMKRFARPSCS